MASVTLRNQTQGHCNVKLIYQGRTYDNVIASEVQKLRKSDIIEPSSSPWRAQVLVTTNQRHKKRMVIDYYQTITKYTYLDAYRQKRVDDRAEKVSQYEYFSSLDLQSASHQILLKQNEKPFTAFDVAGNLYQFKRIPFGVTNAVSCLQRITDYHHQGRSIGHICIRGQHNHLWTLKEST